MKSKPETLDDIVTGMEIEFWKGGDRYLMFGEGMYSTGRRIKKTKEWSYIELDGDDRLYSLNEKLGGIKKIYQSEGSGIGFGEEEDIVYEAKTPPKNILFQSSTHLPELSLDDIKLMLGIDFKLKQ